LVNSVSGFACVIFQVISFLPYFIVYLYLGTEIDALASLHHCSVL